ncbi:hypothetical protein [Paraliomyxa miuraensis]|uniref:hypothetical protein n=1 Tax=Paraliomyxa miuraensis TaxID=376150 RepID=UPI00225181DC|nr:hypothetical protein [Paraliomyxa miuraensis]MCX4241661.1 hypothetical protein [Paraliomyxa miuraensis]
MERLLAEHGPELYRYCVAMLGTEGARALLPTILGHLQDHAHELEAGSERLVVLAVGHNRCLERSRTGGRPPNGQGLSAVQANAVRALAHLRPVGRDAIVLRSLLGLSWAELERVCGQPSARLVMRTSRGWRNVGSVVEGGKIGPGQRPKGNRLSEDASDWAAIREDARRFVGLRNVLREVVEGYAPPDDWLEQAWLRLEEERREQQRQARVRAAERETAAKEAAARAAAKEAQAEAAREAARPSGGAFSESSVDEEEHEAEAPSRPRSLRWLVLGVVLAVVGLAARWLMLR